MASSTCEKPHAIMISYTLQGHINPFVNLALKLASKGFSITFAHLESIHHVITKSQHNSSTNFDIFSGARDSGLDINYTTISDGFPLDFDRFANFKQFFNSFLSYFPDIVDDFVKGVIQSRSSNVFLIADTLYEWPQKIAKKHGLVNISFWTEPAIVFSLYYHLELLRENGHVPVNGQEQNVDYVPGIESINTKDLMTHLQNSETTFVDETFFRAFDKVKNADFILCNTVQELEVETISALQKKQPFYAIGPVFPLDFSRNPVPRSQLPEFDCTEWLNAKAPGSVLYVSFGSLATISDKNVILEIASGILLSDVNFIWAIRPGITGTGDDEVFHEGFEERIKDRGLIVPWCNQNLVLSNPAIGGFLTHCGWNSVLESIWCGVPMLCYPLLSDQPTNRKLVVDDWRIGMNLCDDGSVGRDEVAKKIRSLMSGKMRDEVRHELKKVKKTLQNARARDGTSEKNFDQFVHDVSAQVERRSKKI